MTSEYEYKSKIMSIKARAAGCFVRAIKSREKNNLIGRKIWLAFVINAINLEIMRDKVLLINTEEGVVY